MIWFLLMSCDSPDKQVESVTSQQQQATVDQIEETPQEWALPLDEPYIMAFHSCDTKQGECGNPLRHRVHVAVADELEDWFIVDDIPAFDGSVPDVLIRDGILYLYSLPELRRLDLRTGEWFPSVMLELYDENEQPILHVDPSVTLDEEGRIVLFFMAGVLGQDPATCGPEESSCSKDFYSATEQPGSIGTDFQIDPGLRMSISIGPGEIAADSDIFEGPDGFYQYVSRGQMVQLFYATDLRGSYTPVESLPNGMVTAQACGGVPSGYYDFEEQMFRVFVSSQQGSLSVIRMASHHLLQQLRDDDFQTILQGSDFFSEEHLVSSPGIWLNGGGE